MYQIFLSEYFNRQVKGFLKKDPELFDGLIAALKESKKENGISLGAGAYKIRVGSKSTGKGKSGAYRMIILLIEIQSIIAPLTLYAKSDRTTISRQEIMYHAAMVKREVLLS